MRMWIWGG